MQYHPKADQITFIAAQSGDDKTEHRYRRQRIAVGESNWFFVWTPEGQTTKETLELLCEAYRERHPYA